ncbi:MULTISPECIES: hypothetical protein [unclassified Leifsonia]|uniref:hypothetical protein n=1 Tax=unclassified Leifsonia TaxID=2663824 RepID=UPI0006FF11D2|nr:MULTISPECIES: hypothetical protein [unclassified Leifsonia]KQX06659.1 hypothetical protein ASC59_02050 [Leifsonia sp. Root1293]KRA10943.1 hypothetical protein ASD61_02050 [Leifsonia sp. Root60]
MTNISTGDISPGDSRDGDRKNLPVTEPNDDEIAKHSSTGSVTRDGEGVGIAGDTTPLPDDDQAAGDTGDTA